MGEGPLEQRPTADKRKRRQNRQPIMHICKDLRSLIDRSGYHMVRCDTGV